MTKNPKPSQKSHSKVAPKKISWRNVLFDIFLCGISLGIGFKWGLSKGDVQEVVNLSFSKFSQEYLRTDEYKKYLEVYKVLYKKSLESLFTGGYTTLGSREGNIVSPGKFAVTGYLTNIGGNFTITPNNINVKLEINYLETPSKVMIITGHTETNISNYKIGEVYKLVGMISSDWNPCIIVLDNSEKNPVIVFGVQKNV